MAEWQQVIFWHGVGAGVFTALVAVAVLFSVYRLGKEDSQ